MKQHLSVDIDLHTVVQKLLEDGDSDTIVEFMNLLAAEVKDTHGRQHVKIKPRYDIFLQRAQRELDEDAVLLIGMMFEHWGGPK